MTKRGTSKPGRKPESELVHGTQWGYQRHNLRGEVPCEDCRQAFNEVQRERNARSRAKRSKKP